MVQLGDGVVCLACCSGCVRFSQGREEIKSTSEHGAPKLGSKSNTSCLNAHMLGSHAIERSLSAISAPSGGTTSRNTQPPPPHYIFVYLFHRMVGRRGLICRVAPASLRPASMDGWEGEEGFTPPSLSRWFYLRLNLRVFVTDRVAGGVHSQSFNKAN